MNLSNKSAASIGVKNLVVTEMQGVFFPAGVRVFPAGNLKYPQEILTKTLIIEQKLIF